MVERFIIYGLVDPRSGCVRYVGKSSNGLKRARCHAYPANVRRHRGWRNGAWVAELAALGLRPDVVTLEVVDRADLNVAERFWIASLRASGSLLLNRSDGGEWDTRAWTADERARRGELMRARYIGRPRSVETVQRMRDAAAKRSPEERENMRISASRPRPRSTGAANHGWLDIDTERDIVSPIRAGATMSEVARSLGRSRPFIRQRLRLAGVDYWAIAQRARARLPESVDTWAIVRLWLDGARRTDMARRFGVAPATIDRRIRSVQWSA